MGHWGWIKGNPRMWHFGDFGTNEVWATKHANDAATGVSRKKERNIGGSDGVT